MTVTTSGKVIDSAVHPALRELNAYLSRVERKLFVDRYIRGRPLNELKSEYITDEAISGRHFNSIAAVLDGVIKSKTEIGKLEAADLKDRIKATEAKVRKLQRSLKQEQSLLKSIDSYKTKKAVLKAQGKVLPMPQKLRGKDRQVITKNLKALRFLLHQKKRRLGLLQSKLLKYQDKKPKVCFGSRKLWRQQHHLGQAGFGEHKGWLSAWRLSRNGRSFFVGTHSEPCRNQNAQYDPIRRVLKLRMPGGLEDKWGKTLEVPVTFAYREEELVRALSVKRKQFCPRTQQWRQRYVPVSYRIAEKRPGEFYVYASFETEAPDVASNPEIGAIGIDLNLDHIATAETDRHGNPIAAASYPFQAKGSSDQLKAQMSDHIAQIVSQAKATGKIIVCEQLDFKNKKAALREQSTRVLRRGLSSFAYSHFFQNLESRCRREGVELKQVNPAFTSMIGFYKYRGYRRHSSHELAALAIARRGLGFSERPKTYNAPGRTESISGLGDPGRFFKEASPGHVWSYYSRHKETIRGALHASSIGRSLACDYSLHHPSGIKAFVLGGYAMTRVGRGSIVKMSKQPRQKSG